MSGLKNQLLALILRHARAQRHKAGPEGVMVFRKQIEKAGKNPKLSKDTKITPVTAGAVPAEWVEGSSSRAHRVILYFHGGGYCCGSPETHRLMVSKLCQQAHARALVPDYRLGPENPFPGAFDDGLACYRWLLASGIDPAGIAFAGDSAGGGLALATAMAVRDAGLPQPAALVLLSPWVDLTQSGRTMLTHVKKDPFLSIFDLAMCAYSYLNGHNPSDPHASPLFGDFQNLPSILMHVGSNEVLLDDAVRVSKLAEAAGVDVSVEVWDEMFHVFQAMPLKEAEASLARLGSFIRSRTVLAAVAKTTAP